MVAVNEFGFSKVAQDDKPVNSYSPESIDFFFTPTTGTGLIVPYGDLAIDFADIYQQQPSQRSVIDGNHLSYS